MGEDASEFPSSMIGATGTGRGDVELDVEKKMREEPKKLMTTENSAQVELPKNFLQKGTRSSRLHTYLCMTLANRKSGQNRFSDSRDKLHHSIT